MAVIEEIPDEPTLIQRIPKKRNQAPLNIPYDEQQRIVEESGVLKLAKEHMAQIPRPPPTPSIGMTVLVSVSLVIVYAVLQMAFLMHFGEHFELSVHDKHVGAMLLKMATVLPGFLVLVYVSSRFNEQRWMQLLLLATSVSVGIWDLRLMTKRNVTYGQLSISPALGAVWAYCLIQLDLLYASSGLLLSLVTHALLQSLYYTP